VGLILEALDTGDFETIECLEEECDRNVWYVNLDEKYGSEFLYDLLKDADWTRVRERMLLTSPRYDHLIPLISRFQRGDFQPWVDSSWLDVVALVDWVGYDCDMFYFYLQHMSYDYFPEAYEQALIKAAGDCSWLDFRRLLFLQGLSQEKQVFVNNGEWFPSVVYAVLKYVVTSLFRGGSYLNNDDGVEKLKALQLYVYTQRWNKRSEYGMTPPPHLLGDVKIYGSYPMMHFVRMTKDRFRRDDDRAVDPSYIMQVYNTIGIYWKRKDDDGKTLLEIEGDDAVLNILARIIIKRQKQAVHDILEGEKESLPREIVQMITLRRLLQDFCGASVQWNYVYVLAREMKVPFEVLRIWMNEPRSQREICNQLMKHLKVSGDERITHDPFRNLPCDVLLKIADSIPPTDYARFAQISTYVYDCLKTGRGINRNERERAINRLEAKREEFEEEQRRQIDQVRRDPFSIGDILNPSERVQLVAVMRKGNAIRYIKNPSERVQLVGVEQDRWAIEYIENPSEKVQLAAVTQWGMVIEYIENPSQEVQLAAVMQNGWAIQYIKNPSEEVQLAAVEQDGRALIENPSKRVQLAAVEQDGRALQFIKNPSDEVQLAAVREKGWVIKYIENPSKEVKVTAVNKCGRAIQYIKDLSKNVQLAAVTDIFVNFRDELYNRGITLNYFVSLVASSLHLSATLFFFD